MHQIKILGLHFPDLFLLLILSPKGETIKKGAFCSLFCYLSNPAAFLGFCVRCAVTSAHFRLL